MGHMDFLLNCIRLYAKEKGREEVEVFKSFSRNGTLDYIVDNFYILEKEEDIVKVIDKYIEQRLG